MPNDAFTHFVFVDFENVPEVDLSALSGHRVIVTLFLGKKSKLKVGLVEQITRLPFEVRLIKVGMTQKNALDFVLAFHLGRTAVGHAGARFYIVSHDKKDFDPLVTQLQADRVRVERVDSIAALSFLPPPAPNTPLRTATPAKVVPANKKQVVDKTSKVLARLRNPTNSNRPTTEKALRAHIETGLGKESSAAKVEEIIAQLRDDNFLTIEPSGKLIWAKPAV
jgi:hypothetical protein